MQPNPSSLQIMTSPLKPIQYQLDVSFLPALLKQDTLAKTTVVVTDVLRATTTIINALNNGCRQVIPQPDIETARQTHQQIPNSILGGERSGKLIPGFHQGNSPLEYTPEVIAEKTLILATTNGTVALEHCRGAKQVLIGAFANLSAVLEALQGESRVTIVCSGTDGLVTGEDVLFAGALVEAIACAPNVLNFDEADPEIELCQISDTAKIAFEYWRASGSHAKRVTQMKANRGGINLVKIGHEADIDFAARLDTVPVVPRLDVESWSIRLNPGSQNQPEPNMAEPRTDTKPHVL